MRNSKFVRCVSLFLSASLIISSSLAPRKSHAALAGGFGGATIIPMVFLGGGAIIGVGGTVLSIVEVDNTAAKVVLVILSLAVGLAAGFFGLIILDDGTAGSFHYGALSDAQVSQLDVQPEQAALFRDELPEINAVAEQIGADMVRDGMTSVSQETLEYVATKWTTYGANLSLESLQVVQKLGAFATAQANLRLAQ